MNEGKEQERRLLLLSPDLTKGEKKKVAATLRNATQCNANLESKAAFGLLPFQLQHKTNRTNQPKKERKT